MKLDKTLAGPLIQYCPALVDMGVPSTAVRQRSYIPLSDYEGARAEELLKAAIQKYGSLAS